MVSEPDEVMGSLPTVLDALPVGVSVIDGEGRVAYVNRRLAELMGVGAGDWLGQDWATCLLGVAPDARPDALEDIQALGRTLSRARATLADGLGVVEVFDDVTEARERDRISNELAGLMAHELLNLLTPVLVSARLLRDRPSAPAEKRERYLALIADRSLAVADLIQAITDMFRLNAGRLKFNWTSVDLAQLAQQVADAARARTERPLEVETEPATVRGDAKRLTQVLDILLDNAVKYTPGESAIAVRVERRDGAAVLSVRDSGPGIPPHLRERIFEPFQRGDPALSVTVLGHGLGLAIARGIASAHGGSLSVASEPGAGTTFALNLPLASVNGLHSPYPE